MTPQLTRLLSQISEAEQRFRRNQERFETNRAKIAAGSRLLVDSRERVSARIRRAVRLVHSPEEPAADSVALERILGRSDLLNINFFEIGLVRAKSIGRVVIRAGSTVQGFGTGFLISPRLLLTNNHVLGSPEEAESSTVEFDFALDAAGSPRPVVTFALKPSEFFRTDEGLDYACVAVEAVNSGGVPLGNFSFLRVIQELPKVVEGEPLNIIQHPGGDMKQLACRENDLINVLDEFLLYRTDTAPGSSGSPVFSDIWELVALHHAGRPKRDAQGRILAIDGSVWTSAMGEHRIAWLANEGARISKIAAHLQGNQGLSAAQRNLRDEIFTAVPAPPESRLTRAAQSASGAVSAVDGGATWTIPLRISVQISGPSVPALPSAPVVTAAAAYTTAPVPAPGNGVPANDPEDDRISALRRLAEARTRPYYDEARDGEDAATYYGDLAPGADRGLFFEQLHTLLESTHVRRPSYRPAVHLYPFVDLQPGDGPARVRSVYSGQTFLAEDFINEDFEIERARERFANELMAAGMESSRIDELNLIEATHPFNCEHVVPQSWFRRREPMRGDLHHLFACESGCNSFRGNIPYFDFPDFEEAIRSECGKRETGKFEPGAGKGEVARATLYFLLRYPGEAANADAGLPKSRIATLLDWHSRYAVTLHEKHRNAAIFESQGNRNPLIDHPEWADRINFLLGLTASDEAFSAPTVNAALATSMRVRR